MSLGDTTMWLPPTLKTDRLILRAVTKEDLPALYTYASNPEVAKYTMWQPHRSIKDTEEFFEHYILKKYADEETEPFAITLKENPDKMIGTMGCLWVSRNSEVMELAYAIAQDFWGQGIMSEAAREVIDYSFKNNEVNKITACFKSENIGSGRVMEKIGMSYDGCLRADLFHNGRFWDMKHYSILRDEWEK